MANYFVINNKFRPYSFDELIKPYQMYGQAYREQEATLDAAREKEFSPDYLDQNLDKPAYDMYTQATQGLQSVSDELATKGLSASLRGRLRNTARDYQRTMGTLNEAQQRLYAERERRAKLGEDYVYQQDNLRIGDFLNGATPNQKSASLSGITKDIATEFATRAKTISKDTWDKVLDKNGKVVNGYFDVTTESGLTAAQLDSILADASTWENIMEDTSISKADKDNLRRFREVIDSKKQALGYSDYTPDNQYKIDDAIVRGASAGLGSTAHQYQKDASYNPLGWSQLKFQKDQYRDAQVAAEAPYTHSDESNPTAANRTGLKPGYSIKNGKLQYSSGVESTSSGKASTAYTTTTPGITLHTNKGTSDYSNWEKAREANAGKSGVAGMFSKGISLDNLPTVAIEDITDPDIKRALLNRINVPNVNASDADLDYLIDEYMPQLLQLTVQVSGKKGDRDYVWAVSDKKVQRLTNDSEQSEEISADDKLL